MKCCPEGSWPQLAVDYSPKGQNIKIEGVTTYHIGSGEKGLLIIEDIFGIDSGRHRVIADIFAAQGYNVFMPEFLQPPYGGPMEFPAIVANIKGQNYQAMEENFCKVVGHMKAQGLNKFVSIGFCWGTWFAFKMASKYECFKCIMGPHPSLGAEGMLGGVPAKLAETVKCPAYMLPAGNDPDDVKEKGEIIEILAKRFGAEMTGTTHFPDMVHGWTTRGDLKDEKVSRDFHKALQLTKEYLAKFK